MAFINETGAMGQVIVYMTQNLTGSEFLTYFFIFLLLVLLGIMFKMPLELTIAYTLPLALVLAIGFASFVPVIGVMALYAAFFLARRFLAS